MNDIDGFSFSKDKRPLIGRSLARPDDSFTDSLEAMCPRSRYVFVGLSSGAGATAIAFAFAEYMAKVERSKPKREFKRLVTTLEVNDFCDEPKGSSYDRIGCDRRFAGRAFESCYAIASSGRSVRSVANMDGGVNWLLKPPGVPLEPLSAQDWLRLIGGVAGDIIICDISGSFRKEEGKSVENESLLRRILCDADHIMAIVDPLPSAMMADPSRLELIKEMEASGSDVQYILNKMNAGVNMRELRAFLKIRVHAEIPYFDPAQIYSAEYNCCTLFAMPKLQETLKGKFDYLQRM